jgi:small subunit ribosomal protein S1
MVKDPQLVYAKAEEMAAKYREQLNAPPAVMEIAVEASAEEEEYEVPDAMEEAEIPEEVATEEVEEVEEAEAVTEA